MWKSRILPLVTGFSEAEILSYPVILRISGCGKLSGKNGFHRQCTVRCIFDGFFHIQSTGEKENLFNSRSFSLWEMAENDGFPQRGKKRKMWKIRMFPAVRMSRFSCGKNVFSDAPDTCAFLGKILPSDTDFHKVFHIMWKTARKERETFFSLKNADEEQGRALLYPLHRTVQS